MSRQALSISGSAVKTYVLMTTAWNRKKTEAVIHADGDLVYIHGPTGIGIATSAAPDFVRKVTSSQEFYGVAQDRMVRWQPTIQSIAVQQTDVFPQDGSYSRVQWNMEAMDVTDARDAGCTGKGVRVAIIDGGIDADHPDLAANLDLTRSISFVPRRSFYADLGWFWHGTHVAGIVAAADNGSGITGVAPEATLVGIKVLEDGRGTFAWILGGIIYAATPMALGGAGADIINLSLAANFPRSCMNRPPLDQTAVASGCTLLIAALNKALAYAESQGALVISAAGDDAVDFDQAIYWTSQPAEADSSIAIAATGPAGLVNGTADVRRVASYTNHGVALVHVAAPGGDASLYPEEGWWYDMVLSANRDGDYALAAGTGMAAPAVAGVAALIKQLHPGAQPAQLKDLLAEAAGDKGEPGVDSMYGRGFVNAYRACTR